ncbi:hypothetical protein F443_00319, partial [Phytophthora nicotianae P1569]
TPSGTPFVEPEMPPFAPPFAPPPSETPSLAVPPPMPPELFLSVSLPFVWLVSSVLVGAGVEPSSGCVEGVVGAGVVIGVAIGVVVGDGLVGHGVRATSVGVTDGAWVNLGNSDDFV